jgi:hypothetical protein
MHIAAMPLDAKPRCKTRGRIGRALRYEKDTQAISLKPPHCRSRRQVPIAAEANASNLGPIELEDQRGW